MQNLEPNMKNQSNASETIKDIFTLIKHVSYLPIWTSGGKSEVRRLGNAKAQERRMKEIKRLSGSIKAALYSHSGPSVANEKAP